MLIACRWRRVSQIKVKICGRYRINDDVGGVIQNLPARADLGCAAQV